MHAMAMSSDVRKFLVLCGAMLMGLVTASMALAGPVDWRQHTRDHADNVIYLSREVRQELVHVARHSCLFGQMMAEVGRMESNAAILRGWTYHQAPLKLESKVHELAANSDRLQALIEEAWGRGQRGIHKPLLCTQRLRGMMQRVDAEIFAAYQSIPGPQTVYRAPRPCPHWGGAPLGVGQPGWPSDWRRDSWERDQWDRTSHRDVGGRDRWNAGGWGVELDFGRGVPFCGSDSGWTHGHRIQDTRPRFEDTRPRVQNTPQATFRIGGLEIDLGGDSRHSVGRRHEGPSVNRQRGKSGTAHRR